MCEGTSLRKVLALAASAAVGTALLSCSETRPPANESAAMGAVSYEHRAPVVRAPLAPPVTYASPPTGPVGWNASPRWSAVRGDGCVEVEQDPEGKFKVENCLNEDASQPATP